MKLSEIALLAGAGFLAYRFLIARNGGGTAAAPAASTARYFGALAPAFGSFSAQPNPVIDGRIDDNYLDLIFAPGGFYGGRL